MQGSNGAAVLGCTAARDEATQGMTDLGDVRAAVHAWLGDAVDPERTAGPGQLPLNLPSWERVAAAVLIEATPDRRPDLYAPERPADQPALRAHTVLEDTGVARLIDVARHGYWVDVDTVADQFAAFLTMKQPAVQAWLLLDAEIPLGTDVVFGPWRLVSPGSAALRSLAPVENAHEYLPDRRRIDASLYGQSAFLIRDEPDCKPVTGHLWFYAQRPEQLAWEPLLVLALWRHDVVRLDGRYHVEPGRRVDTAWSQPSIDYRGRGEDDEWEEWHRPGDWELGATDVEAFSRFADVVYQLLAYVLGRTAGKRQRKTERRLRRAGQHLVRAAQRSFHGGTVDEEDRDEVLMHYVIAIEALLADEESLDLSRKVAYRGAALHVTDAERVRVRTLLIKACNARSKYAHGDETTEDDVDLHALRDAALTLYLRWLVLHAQAREEDVPTLLDLSVLEDGVRSRQVHAPLLAFHEETPTFRTPADFVLTPPPRPQQAGRSPSPAWRTDV